MRTGKGILLAACLAAEIILTGCVSLSTHANPESIATDNGKARVYAKLMQDGKALGAKNVTFSVSSGEECIDANGQTFTSPTNDKGLASAEFSASAGVENCTATITVSAEGKTEKVVIRVKPQSLAAVRIDGVSAIALILIASFAVDRIVRGILFLLAFWPRWSAKCADPEDPNATPEAKRRYRLAYLGFAAIIGTGILAWYGGVRVLSALGFVDVNPLLDALITGLIIVGGAERTEAILKSLGGGGGVEGAAAAPVQVSGTIVMADQKRDAAESAASH